MTDTNNTDGAALLPVTQDASDYVIGGPHHYVDPDSLEEHWIAEIQIVGGHYSVAEIYATDPAHAVELAEKAIAAWNTRAPLPATQEDAERSGVGEDERLRALSARAAPAPWVVYSEPEVGLFASVFSGTVMETGFAPVNLDDPANVELIVEAVNYLRLALSTPAMSDRQEYDGKAVREALAPFARAAKWWKAFDNQHRITTLHQHGDCLEVGHLRAAEAALAHPAQARDEMPAECPNSPSGKHQIDTSMEEGPHHCFYCGTNMRALRPQEGEASRG